MDTRRTIEYWQEGAAEALRVADSLMEKEHYAEALFFGHLALEKTLKALVVKVIGDHPPYTHDLGVLAKWAHLDVSDEQRQFLKQVNEFNLEGRYPEDIRALRRRLAGGEALMYMGEIKKFNLWIHSRLQS